MYDIIVQVRNQRIKCVDQTIVSDSRNHQYVKFEFDSDWDGLIKTAVFRNGENVFNVLIDDTCRCLIPEGALKSGVLEISVFGGDRITATAACFNVVKSGYVSADAPPAPEPDVYASLVELAANAVNVANEVRADADSGKFNGAAGPQGPQGETGPAGKDGSSDWNTLENRPFYEKERVYKLDGNLSGRDVIEYNGTFYKVSDDLPTPDELNAGVVYDSDGNKQYDMSHQDAQGNETIYIEAMAGFLIVVYDKYFNPDGLSNHEAPSTGVYINANYNYELRLSNLIKTIDKKFLPDGIGGDADWNTLKNKPFYEDNVFDLTWDGTTTIRDVTVNSGMYHLVSETVPNINSLANSEIYLTSGSETKKVDAEVSSLTNGFVMIGDYVIICYEPNYAGAAIQLPEIGVYLLNYEAYGYISHFRCSDLVTIPEKYIKTPTLRVQVNNNTASVSSYDIYLAYEAGMLVVANDQTYGDFAFFDYSGSMEQGYTCKFTKICLYDGAPAFAKLEISKDSVTLNFTKLALDSTT